MSQDSPDYAKIRSDAYTFALRKTINEQVKQIADLTADKAVFEAERNDVHVKALRAIAINAQLNARVQELEAKYEPKEEPKAPPVKEPEPQSAVPTPEAADAAQSPA